MTVAKNKEAAPAPFNLSNIHVPKCDTETLFMWRHVWGPHMKGIDMVMTHSEGHKHIDSFHVMWCHENGYPLVLRTEIRSAPLPLPYFIAKSGYCKEKDPLRMFSRLSCRYVKDRNTSIDLILSSKQSSLTYYIATTRKLFFTRSPRVMNNYCQSIIVHHPRSSGDEQLLIGQLATITTELYRLPFSPKGSLYYSARVVGQSRCILRSAHFTNSWRDHIAQFRILLHSNINCWTFILPSSKRLSSSSPLPTITEVIPVNHNPPTTHHPSHICVLFFPSTHPSSGPQAGLLHISHHGSWIL